MSTKNRKSQREHEAAAERARAQRFLQELGSSRRRFLSNMASGTAGAAFALASGRKSMYAWADSQAQACFSINIHLRGGWDSNWFHMAFPRSKISSAADNPNLITGMPSQQYDNLLPKPGDPKPGGGTYQAGSDPFGRSVDIDSSNSITQLYHGAYTERTRSQLFSNSQYQHPSANGHYFGTGLVNAWAGSTGLLAQRSCILKGLYSGGAHDIPNKVIIHGSESQYAIPYSGLISAALAQRQGKRKLHYMQLTGAPGDYGANWAMAKGDQVPINCPDYDAFKKLIARAEDDFTTAADYNAVNESVKRLGGQLSAAKFLLSQSKSIYESFVSSFRNALEISELSSQMGGFLNVWAEYANYARERLAYTHSNSFIDTVSTDVVLPLKDMAYNTHTFAAYDAGLTTREKNLLPTDPNKHAIYENVMTSYATALSTPFSASEASLNVTGGTFAGDGAQLRIYVAQAAWKFALAEYLVSSGHSTVVDLAFNTGDMHGDNSNDLRHLTIIFSLHAKMLQRLAGVQVPGTGSSYLDRTLVTMFSEFDRTAALATDTSKDNRGTGHDITESIIFSGFGIKQGTVVGDRRYGGLAGPELLEYQPGKTAQVDYKYAFPTIMKIFGVEIPAQQISDGTYIAAVIAGY